MTPRTNNRFLGGNCASRGLRYASAILAPSWIFEDAARTPRLGRENLSPRWGDFGDTTTHDDRINAHRWKEGRKRTATGDALNAAFRLNRVNRVCLEAEADSLLLHFGSFVSVDLNLDGRDSRVQGPFFLTLLAREALCCASLTT